MALTPHRIGKIAPATFDHVIRSRLGRVRPEVVLGPLPGVDVGVVDLGGGQALVVTTDPLFVVPAYGWDRAAWFALHIIASDAATSGLAPQYASVDLNLPPDMPDADLAAFWNGFHHACDEIGVAIVTGHTGRCAGCAFPTIGAATIFAVGPAAQLATPPSTRPGDVVIVTKGPAIETVGQLGVIAHARLAAACGDPVARAAEALFRSMSVVRDAQAAAAAGVGERGVTAMHDATEFGLHGALVEVANAAGVGLLVDRSRIPMPDVVRAVCAHYAIDPFTASSEGTLVVTCRAPQAGEVVRRLEDQDIAAAIVGEAVPREAGLREIVEGVAVPLTYPAADPFWDVFTAELSAAGKRLDRVGG